jgi:hypothetical protein
MNGCRASILIIALGLLTVYPHPVSAKELQSVDFSRDLGIKAIGKGGVKDNEGWAPSRDMEESGEYIVVPVAPGENFSVQKGTIEIVLKRRKIGGSAYGHNTILSFVDNTNYSPLSVYLVLEGGKGYLLVNSPGAREYHWGRRIPLPGSIEVGQTLHFAFTWGPDPVKENAVFYNGKRIPPIDGKSSSPLAPLLEKVNRIVVGGDFGAGTSFPVAGSIASEIKFMKYWLSDDVKTAFLKPSIQSLQDDSFKIPGISGKLVAGDTVTVTLVAETGGKSSFDMGDVKGIAMEEVPATEGGPGVPAVDNGTYQGSYTIQPGDDYEDGYIVGHFVSADNVVAEPVASVSKWTIDTKPVVTFDIGKKDIPADSSTKARIKLVAKDANGDPVRGRRLKLTLATTEEYTGTVGAGDFGQNVGATVETRWRGETDAWGEVEFDYIAGFAAKTVILTAKDLNSGGVTVDYITAYKEAAIDIALTPPVNRAAARRGVQYIIKVEASRTELTADGRSRSVIRAKVMDPNGNPVVGDPVTFTLSSENGTLRTIKGTTDSSGVAIAEYRAGKKIGGS